MDPLDGHVQGAPIENGGENFCMPFIEKVPPEVHLAEDISERNARITVLGKT